ncbi:MAG: thioesterase II family protein [Pseudonocardiaceae bacterium]
MQAKVTDPGRWLRCFNPMPSAPRRLICLPHAGASASYYFALAKALCRSVDVVVIQYPGRQDRYSEPCRESIAELAEEITTVVRPLADRPLAFFGHSMGAVLAFEVARPLEAEGIVLTGLFASGRRAPSMHRDERIHLRDDEGLIAEVRTLSGTDAQLFEDEEIMRMVLPAIRSDYKAVETYRYQPGPDLSCPIFALIGTDDSKVTVDEARAWARHTRGEFRLSTFSGGHFYLNSCLPEVVEQLAEHLGV